VGHFFVVYPGGSVVNNPPTETGIYGGYAFAKRMMANEIVSFCSILNYNYKQINEKLNTLRAIGNWLANKRVLVPDALIRQFHLDGLDDATYAYDDVARYPRKG